MPELDSVVNALKSAFPDAIEDVQVFRGDTTVIVSRERLLDICRYCRDTEGLEYDFLSDVAGVDYYPAEPRFGLAYSLYSMNRNASLRLKLMLPGEDPVVDSVTPVYPAANWQEREYLDLLGITFTGHPDPRRILLPDDWEGHPLRKDYPLGYETVQFSFNYDEIAKHKPLAQK
ncbi:NADH-quinone oxidoreductase subunit C [Aggregatilinea lenta]|uniref:NADH-quinone oxidoreductase subunit C n=1 Tax=Aggregatilinea lenta TaxID=913108 RepID=UPI000E5B59A1|nr:NADH-quinone oxidoreductase subunit C [Aggregatilinea lenta]